MINMTKRDKLIKDAEYIMEKLDCSYSESLDVIKWDTEGVKEEEQKDKEKKKAEREKRKANALPTGVQDSEVELVREVILELYPTELFTSKELSKDKRLIKKAESLGKQVGRWTPHRLKKLETEGFLVSGKPKSVKYYKVNQDKA